MAKVSNVSVPASGLVRFSIGANELAVSAQLGAGIKGRAAAMAAFLDTVILSHGVSIADCLKKKTDRIAGNGMAQAQYEFVRKCYGIAIFGADMTDRILSAKTTDNTVLDFGDAVTFKTGVPIKPNTARYVMQNQLGPEFAAFLSDLQAVQAGEDKKRGAGTTYTDMQRVAKMLNAAIKVCRKVDTADGSIDLEVAAKFEKFLADGMKTFGIKE
jgi:hypothetical protein